MFGYKTQCWFFIVAAPLLGMGAGFWVGSELGADPIWPSVGAAIGMVVGMLLGLPWMLRHPPKKDSTTQEDTPFSYFDL